MISITLKHLVLTHNGPNTVYPNKEQVVSSMSQ